ncbi:MarR family transcriptional regulator [Rugamonas sp.]|uniref:MarR family winged helix-turn-helix transcriptional regulator n=1 Tax=Rugamonas sp. TaxID=1926287 RepID=UPI0025D1B4E7|nr:MarR family transcriptional regulator [Rugamonas sp.]
MSSIEERFTAAVHSTARGWRTALDRRLKYLGISQASWLAIAYAAKSGPEPLSQTRLAASVGVENPTMVVTIDRLVTAGYMVRTPSALDRRVKLVSLTPEGEEIYAKVKIEADAFRREILHRVDRGALRAATELLEALQASIETLT